MEEITREDVYSSSEACEVLGLSRQQFKSFLRKHPDIPKFKLLKDKRFTYYDKQTINELAVEACIFIRI